MKPEKIETGMIRGYVTVCDRSACCIGRDQPDCITAYTFWYRHDEDLKRLEVELEQLHKVYSNMGFYRGCMMGYETKPYKDQ